MDDNSKTPQPELEGLGDVRRVVSSVPPATDEDTLATAKLDWRDAAEVALLKLAASGRTFTANDLSLQGVPAAGHPSWWGALFRVASCWGLIVPVGYTQSGRRTRSGGSCHVWIGAEHVGGVR